LRIIMLEIRVNFLLCVSIFCYLNRYAANPYFWDPEKTNIEF
jgi:hypothetical protein